MSSDATLLLARVVQTYAAMSSYHDSGSVQLLDSEDPPFQTDFTTIFRRPSLFRFEFSRPHAYAPLRHVVSRHVVGFDGAAAYHVIERYEKPAQLELQNDVQRAIAKVTGVSSGSAHTIARLLLPQISGFSIPELLEPRMGEDAQIDGISCHQVAATHPRGGDMTYTIEKDSLLIRRVRTNFGSFPAQECRDNIGVDQPLEDGLFQISCSDPATGRVARR